jgi:hypothetical protein
MIDQYTAEEMGYKKEYDSGSAHTYYRPYPRQKVLFKASYNHNLYNELRKLINNKYRHFEIKNGRVVDYG